MNAKAEKANSSSPADTAKLVVAAVVLAAGIAGFYWFSTAPQVLRLLGLGAVVVIACAIAAFTALGRRTRTYLVETRFEMRKVVWPTRDETLKTTVVVLIVVVILSLLLGLIDLILKSVILDWLLKMGS